MNPQWQLFLGKLHCERKCATIDHLIDNHPYANLSVKYIASIIGLDATKYDNKCMFGNIKLWNMF